MNNRKQATGHQPSADHPFTMRRQVTAADTAVAVGSGDVEVLATPRLITWMEALTARRTAELLTPGQTSVGSSVSLRHRLPSHVGDSVTIVAEPPVITDNRRLQFRVQAVNAVGQILAEGELQRVIVDRERFLTHPS
jgi:fluoroacetyl-CoA thioesterase